MSPAEARAWKRLRTTDWAPAAIATTINVAERYAESALGLADASLVALAERLDTIIVATLDE